MEKSFTELDSVGNKQADIDRRISKHRAIKRLVNAGLGASMALAGYGVYSLIHENGQQTQEAAACLQENPNQDQFCNDQVLQDGSKNYMLELGGGMIGTLLLVAASASNGLDLQRAELARIRSARQDSI